MADFLGQYIANHLISGMSKDDAMDAAEETTGQHCAAELMRKARIMAALFEQYHAATNKAAKQRIRRNINQHVEELYGTDMLCEDDMTWLRARIMDVVPIRPRKNFNLHKELSDWYEVADKQIRKNGCTKCGWHKREQAEWAARKGMKT